MPAVIRVSVFGFRVSGFGTRDSGCGIRVSGFGFRDSGFSGFGVRAPGDASRGGTHGLEARQPLGHQLEERPARGARVQGA